MDRKLPRGLLVVVASVVLFASSAAPQSQPTAPPAVDKQAATSPTPVSDRASSSNTPAPPAANGAVQVLPTTKQLLDKFEKASGGHDAWSSFKTRSMKGIYQTEDASGFAGIEILSKSPNKTLFKITFANGILIREVCDGKSAWIEDPGGGMHEFTGAALKSRIRRANFNDRAASLLLAVSGRVLGTAQVGTHSTYVVEYSPEKNLTSKIYFDAESGLAVRADDTFHQEGTDYKVETYIDDYRPVDGALFPFRIRHVEKGNVFTIKVTQIKNNVPIDDSIFLKPESAPK
jgi:outer membrane lipoprotein-sorting protein